MILNLDTGDALTVRDPQTELVEEIAVNWTQKEPIGGTSSILHFGGTKSKTLNPLVVRYRSRTREDVDEAADAIAFLQSLCYGADSDAIGLSGTPPPLVQFIWPESVTEEGRIQNLRISRLTFNKDGRTLDFDAEIQFVADRSTAPVGRDVRRFGSQ